MNIMRAKMRLTAEKVYADTVAAGAKVYTFQAQYSESKEDNSFAKYTPNANFEMTIDNPEVQALLKLGETYYVDFTPASFPQVQKVADYIGKTCGHLPAAKAVAFNNNPVESPLASEAANIISKAAETLKDGTGLGALREEQVLGDIATHKVIPNPNLPPKSTWLRPQNDFGEN